VSHPLHGRGCYHDGHGDVEAQDLGGETNFGDVNENTRTESGQRLGMSERGLNCKENVGRIRERIVMVIT